MLGLHCGVCYVRFMLLLLLVCLRLLLLELRLAVLGRVDRARRLVRLAALVDCAHVHRRRQLLDEVPEESKARDALWPGCVLASHESMSSPAGTPSKCDACEPSVRALPPCSGGMFCRERMTCMSACS